MINYELALKLKEAGFPQEMKYGDLCFYNEKEYIHTGGGHREAGGRLEGFYYNKGQTCCNDDDNLHFISIYDDLVVKIPTLSELIEACGDGFSHLVRYYIHDKLYWEAETPKVNIIGFSCTSRCETPEEAVANLWLELNESKRNTTIRKN